jgi:hypothetical protein
MPARAGKSILASWGDGIGEAAWPMKMHPSVDSFMEDSSGGGGYGDGDEVGTAGLFKVRRTGAGWRQSARYAVGAIR